VPHLERSDEAYVAINKDFHKTMLDFFLKVNKRERIVGWFATTMPDSGAWIVDNTSLIHDFFASECSNPIHVVVDTALAAGSSDIHVRAFSSRPMVIGEHAVANLFDELKAEVIVSESEAQCIYAMAHGQAPEQRWTDSLTIASVPSEEAAVVASLESLVSTLDGAIAYVEGVISGKIEASPAMGKALSDALNSSFQMASASEAQAEINARLQNLLMSAHVNSLTQAQLNIAEKLNSIL
jgi:translation initiation factor 3 subunit F